MSEEITAPESPAPAAPAPFTPPEDLLTREQYTELAKTGIEVGRVKNVALHKGGSVAVMTANGGKVFGVVSGVAITAAIVTEVAPLLEQARAKAAPSEPTA